MVAQTRETGRGAARAERLETIRAERDRFVALAFAWADLLFELDRDQKIVFATGATTPILGTPPERLEGDFLERHVAPEDRHYLEQLLRDGRRLGRLENAVVHLKNDQGRVTPLFVSGHCLDEFNGHYFLAFRRGAPLAIKPEEAGTRDEESGLLDAAGFADVANDRVAQLRAKGEEVQLTMMAMPDLIDLRGRLDKTARDHLMTTVGATLRANSANGDSAARVAEDRFSLIHQVGLDIADLESRIATLAKEADPLGKGVNVQARTIEMGAGNLSDEDMAKGLVYTINQFRKSKGDDFTVRNLTSSLTDLAAEAIRSVDTFRKIIATSDFEIAFHPIIKIQTGKVHHFEALVRFPVFGQGESPYRHITFAEDTGLIHEFDIAMARKVVDWLSKMPRNNDKYNVAINISGISIGTPAYVEELTKLLRENSWTRGKLMFEVTESARMENLEEAGEILQSFRRLGYEVCLDDFGAGAASFQYLSALDVDVVKLDGSAVKNAQKGPKGAAFLSALTELCRRLGVETVAEMVDHPHSLDFVRMCGVDYVQGYLFGKPSTNIKDFEPLPQGHLFAPQNRRGAA